MSKLYLYGFYLAPTAIGWSAIFCYNFVTPSWILCKIVLAYVQQMTKLRTANIYVLEL